MCNVLAMMSNVHLKLFTSTNDPRPQPQASALSPQHSALRTQLKLTPHSHRHRVSRTQYCVMWRRAMMNDE